MNEHLDVETLTDYLHRELEPERDASVHAHLAHCAACTLAYEAEARLSERLRAYARSVEREIPQGIVARVRSEVDEQQVPWWHFGRVLRPAVGLPVAAALVLATILGFSSLAPHLSGPPAIAASYYLDDHEALASSSLPFSQTSVVPEALEPGGTTNSQNDPARAVGSNIVASE